MTQPQLRTACEVLHIAVFSDHAHQSIVCEHVFGVKVIKHRAQEWREEMWSAVRRKPALESTEQQTRSADGSQKNKAYLQQHPLPSDTDRAGLPSAKATKRTHEAHSDTQQHGHSGKGPDSSAVSSK
jgi:hypothetical protein